MMPTATLLDLGPTPTTPPFPGAPPSIAAGAMPTDFAQALGELLTGPASVVANGERQVAAATGKAVPVDLLAKNAAAPLLVAAPQVDCELPDPDFLPKDDAAGRDTKTPATPENDNGDLPEPALEPALAWLMPPPPVPIGQPVLKLSTVVAKAQGGEPTVTVPPGDPMAAPARLLTSLSAAPSPFDCEMPANPPERTADEPPQVTPRQIADDSAAATGAVLADEQKTLLSQVFVATPGSVRDGDIVMAPQVATAPVVQPGIVPRPVRMTGQGVRSPAVELPSFNTDATGTHDAPPAAPMVRRLAPSDPLIGLQAALVAVVAKDNASPTATVSVDATIAGIAQTAAPGTVAPTASAQQAGIDLTRDPGLHRMIDRIEQLRDGADIRETRIRLIPDALGPVDIAVRRDGATDAVRVHFTAPEAATRQLIVDAQPRLTELAEARGIRIERASVDGGASQSWSGNEHARPQPQQAPLVPRAPARAAHTDTTPTTEDRIA